MYLCEAIGVAGEKSGCSATLNFSSRKLAGNFAELNLAFRKLADSFVRSGRWVTDRTGHIGNRFRSGLTARFHSLFSSLTSSCPVFPSDRFMG